MIIYRICKVIKVSGFYDAMQQIQKNVDYLASLLVITSANDCSTCQEALEIYEVFSNQVEGVVKTYVLDCVDVTNKQEEQHLPVCLPKSLHLLPGVSFLAPPEETYSPYMNATSLAPKEYRLRGELSISSLLKAVDEYSPKFFKSIRTQKQYLMFLNDTKIPNKVIILTANETIPIWFRGLTSYFRHRLEFAQIDTQIMNPPKDLHLNGVYPDIIILKYENGKKQYVQEKYKGGKRLDSLKASLSRIASKEKIRHWKSKFEVDYSNWNVVAQLEFDQIPSLMDLNDQWVMLSLVKNGQPHFRFEQLKEGFRGMFKYYEVDCSERLAKFWIKESLGVDTLPALLIYKLQKKALSLPIEVSTEDTVDLVSESLIEEINLTTKTFYHYEQRTIYGEIRDILEGGKYAIVWFYNSEDHFFNLIARTISETTFYKEQLTFVFIRDPDEETKAVWEIQSVPYIIGFIEINFETGRHKRIDYDDPFSYENIRTYLDNLALNNEQTTISNLAIEESKKQYDFERLCISMKTPCVIAILDERNQLTFEVDLDAFQKVCIQLQKQFKKSHHILKNKKLSWTWIDGNCQKALFKRLKQDKMPVFIYYHPQKDKYIIMDTAFNSQSLVRFVNLVQEGKLKKKWVKIDDQLDLEDSKCASQRDEKKIKLNEKVQKPVQEQEQKRGLSESPKEIDDPLYQQEIDDL